MSTKETREAVGVEAVEAAIVAVEPLLIPPGRSRALTEQVEAALQGALPHLHAAFLADFSKQLLSEEAVEAAARFVHDRHINEVGMVDFPWDERRLDGPWGETARSGREFAKERVRPVIQTALKAANRGPSHAE